MSVNEATEAKARRVKAQLVKAQVNITSLFVVVLLLLGMIAIEPAEARRGGYHRVCRGGGRSAMHGLGRMSRGLSRSLLGGRRGHGGRKHRNMHQNNLAGTNAADPNSLYPNALDPNAVNGGYNNGNLISN